MPHFDPHLFETPNGDQVLKPPTVPIAEGWTASEHFRALPGDLQYGVPDVFPGPSGWGLIQFLRLQKRILGSVAFNDSQQRTLRELIARCLPLFQLCSDVPLTADDIRTKVHGFHKRQSDRMLFCEYAETPGGTPLMLALDAFEDGMLSIFSADCHRDCMPNVPVTHQDYLVSLQKPTPTPEEVALESRLPSDITEGTPAWVNWMALQDTEQALFTLRRRLAQVATANLDRLIPPPIGTSGEVKAVHRAYQASEPGQPIAFPHQG